MESHKPPEGKEPPMISATDTAPDFTLPRDGGGTVTLSALRPGKVVLYFYPKDDTPGCTLEAQDFNARLADFAAAGATVIGISKDSVKSHDKFCKTYMGIQRATFLIDGDGKVAQVWPKVSVKGHADEVLAAVKAL
jgi:peroxiredoxin Q/BCP